MGKKSCSIEVSVECTKLSILLVFTFKFNCILIILEKIRPMDLKALDKALQDIARKRNELSKIDYNNPKYDVLEEELHDAEDTFQAKYGEYLEGALQEV